MAEDPSQVLDSFDGLSNNCISLCLATESDYCFVQSLVCDPSTIAAMNETLDVSQTSLQSLWAQGLRPPDLRHVIAVSQCQENRIGYLRLLYPFEFDECLWMSYLAIVPELRGEGFGRVVLGLLLDGAKSNPHISKFGMHTGCANTRAVRLYESLGFECVKREPWENDDGTEDQRLTLVRDLLED